MRTSPMKTISIYNSLLSKQSSLISVTDALQSIKNGKYSKTINELRQYPKGDVNYEKLKKSLPVIFWNYELVGGKKTENATNPSGYLFIDIDSCNYIDIDDNKIYAMWRSVGNCGYGLLVRCNSYNKDNFKATYLKIIEDLGLQKYYDKSCNSICRCNVISYDENIFINEDSYIYNFDDNDLLNNENKSTIEKTPPTLSILKENNIYIVGGVKNNIIYNNIEQISETLDFGNKEYYYSKEGIDIIKCAAIENIATEGNRQNMLLSYCKNLVCLNPHLSNYDVYSIMTKVSDKMCATKISYERVKNIVDSVFKYKNNGTLKPFYSKRKIFFKDNSLCKTDKFKICNVVLSENKTTESQNKLYNIIEQWDFDTLGKISQAKIVKNNTISKKTVEKYYYIFKDYITELNDKYKTNK